MVLALVRRQRRVDLEPGVLERDHVGHLRVGDRLHAAVQVAGRHGADLRAEAADQRALVHPDVAHVVHRVADQRDLQRPPRRHRRRGPRPAAHVGAERLALPVIGQHAEPPPGPDHGVGGVLRPVHPLVVGHVGHVPRGGDRRLGLDVGQADGQPGFGQQPGDPHRRPVGQHHHQHAVEVGVLKLAHDPLGIFPVLHHLAGDELADPGQAGGELGGIPLLAPGDARDHVVVQVLHDPQDPDPGPSLTHHSLPEGWAEPGSVPAGQRWPYSSWYRRYRASIWSGGSGVTAHRAGQMDRAGRVLAHHRRLHRVARGGAHGEHPVAAQQHGRRAVTRQGRRPPRGRSPRRRSARTGPIGISPPNSSAIAVITQGIGSPRAAHAVAYREWVCTTPPTSGHVPVDVGV